MNQSIIQTLKAREIQFMTMPIIGKAGQTFTRGVRVNQANLSQ